MEYALKRVVGVAASGQVKQVVNIWFPTDDLSNIFLENCMIEFKLRKLENACANMNLNLFIDDLDTKEHNG